MTTKSVEAVLREAGETFKRTFDELADHLASQPTEYLTPREAADQLRVNIQTVYRYCWDGKLAHKKVGKKTLIPVEAVREFFE